jgi:hypothetical protein
MHCKPDDSITVKEASCQLDAPDGGSEEGDGGEPEPATHNNAEADDDDCKYHIKFSSTPIRLNQDVTFTVTVTNKADGKGIPFPSGSQFSVAGVTDNDTHPFPNVTPQPKSTPGANGSFTFGAVRFDKAGDWKVTFHIREDCKDNAEDSPHGHATFLIRVP